MDLESIDFQLAEVRYQGPDGVARTALGKVTMSQTFCVVFDPSPVPERASPGYAPTLVIPLPNVVLAEGITRSEYEATIRAAVARNTVQTILPRNQGFMLRAQAEAQQGGQSAPGTPTPPRPSPQGGGVTVRYGGPPSPQDGDDSHGWGSR